MNRIERVKKLEKRQSPLRQDFFFGFPQPDGNYRYSIGTNDNIGKAELDRHIEENNIDAVILNISEATEADRPEN